MDKYFKTQNGQRVNIIDHTLEQIEKWPNLTICIGTDSQSYARETIYVTVITYTYGHRGVHFIYHREKVKKSSVDWTRLYEEGARTVETADLITSEIPIAIQALEFDFNDYSRTLSQPLVGAFKYLPNAVFKSGQMKACKAADHVCRHPQIYK